MKRRSLIIAAVVVAAAGSSSGFDSSGGAKIAGLLSRVEFTYGGTAEFDPPLFEWTEHKRREVSDALAAILTGMPLDIAGLPEIERLSISNGRCSTSPDPESLEDDPDFKSGNQETRRNIYLTYCGSDTATYYPHGRSLAISGTIYELSRGSSPEARTLFARVLQHELTHAWERDSETKDFYALGHEKRDESWFQVLGRNARIYAEEEARANKAEESQRAAALKRLSDLRTALSRSQDAIFQAMGLPARFGGSTGRVDPLAAPGEDPLDTDSMRTRHEYLAILSELLWVDPPLAYRQYSPEEIAWVQKHVFNGRPVAAFSPAQESDAPGAGRAPGR